VSVNDATVAAQQGSRNDVVTAEVPCIYYDLVASLPSPSQIGDTTNALPLKAGSILQVHLWHF
jgi:hypothetical protein